jgi:monothiol glutaredoxin
MRNILANQDIDSKALEAIANFHKDTVAEVQAHVQKHEWVIVGMRQNPVVKSARRHLDQRKVTFHYLEYGSYLSGWKPRLAIKLWSGWPTYPQVFHKGRLIGGFNDLKAYLP